MKLELEIHVHINNVDTGSLALLEKIYSGLKNGEFEMALSPEMQAFIDASSAAFTSAGESLANISADIQRLLASGTLSAEDKQALLDHTTTLSNLAATLSAQAAVVPET
jgi:hypothetical protein